MLLRLRELAVAFDDGDHRTDVLHHIDVTIRKGEALGLVGESGCGKSVTWLAALRLLGRRAQISGQVLFEDVDLLKLDERALSSVRGRRIAMIFQDPASSLNPLHRVGAQISEALKLHRDLEGAAAQAEAGRLLDRVGIADSRRRLQQYPHELSGGMNQRVMIAMALAGQPDLLIADEPTTALDTTVQAQILDLIRQIRADTGMALVLISHDFGVVAELCDRILVMQAGRIVEDAAADDLFDAPQHPYTRSLLASLPEFDPPQELVPDAVAARPLPVDPPLVVPASGAALALRSDPLFEESRRRLPDLAEPAGGRTAARQRLRVADGQD